MGGWGRFDIEEPEGSDEGQAEEDEVPVVGEFGEEDAAEVAFVAELGEEGGGGAATGELGIDGVDEVEAEAEGVHHYEDPAAHGVPPGALLEVQGEEHEDYPEAVGVEDGRGVEAEAAGKKFAHGELVPVDGEEVPVLEHEGHAGDHV